MKIKTTCAECGTPLWGNNLNKRGDLYYCSADFERLSPEEKAENAKKVREYDDYKKMFDSSGIEELVTNGSFASDVSWTKGDEWTISGGKAHAGGSGNKVWPTISQPSPRKVVGVDYVYIFTISNYVGGSVYIQISTPTFVNGVVQSY